MKRSTENIQNGKLSSKFQFTKPVHALAVLAFQLWTLNLPVTPKEIDLLKNEQQKKPPLQKPAH